MPFRVCQQALFPDGVAAAAEALPHNMAFPVDAPPALRRTTRADNERFAVLIEHVDLPTSLTCSNMLMEALTHQLTGCGVDVLPGQVALLRHRLAVQLALHRRRYLDAIVEAVTRNYGYYDGNAYLDLNRIPNMQAMVDGYIRDTGDAWTARAFGVEVIQACADSEAVNILILLPGHGTSMVSPHEGITPLRTVCLLCSDSECAPRYSSVFRVGCYPPSVTTPSLPPAPPPLCSPPQLSPDSGLESTPSPRPSGHCAEVQIKSEGEEDSTASGLSSGWSDSDVNSVKSEDLGPGIKSGSEEQCASSTRPVHGRRLMRIPVQDKPLTLATWNVGYLSAAGACRGAPLSPWLGKQVNGPSGVARSLAANGVQIAALQGHALESSIGELEGYTVFAHGGVGASSTETGFAVRDDLVGAVSSFVSSPSSRACRLDLFATPMNVSLVSAFAPPEDAAEEVHESFSKALRTMVSAAPRTAVLVVLGDFGAEVGRQPNSLRCVAGKSSLHRDYSSNGVRLVHFARRNDLVIRSTILDKKADARATRMTVERLADGSERISCSQVDHVLVRRQYRGSVLAVRSVPSAGLSDTNHRMVLAVVSVPYGVLAKSKNAERPKPSVSQVLEKMLLWKKADDAAEEMYRRLTNRTVAVKEEHLKQEREGQNGGDLDDVMDDLGKILQEIKECETKIESKSRHSEPRHRRLPSPVSPPPNGLHDGHGRGKVLQDEIKECETKVESKSRHSEPRHRRLPSLVSPPPNGLHDGHGSGKVLQDEIKECETKIESKSRHSESRHCRRLFSPVSPPPNGADDGLGEVLQSTKECKAKLERNDSRHHQLPSSVSPPPNGVDDDLREVLQSSKEAKTERKLHHRDSRHRHRHRRRRLPSPVSPPSPARAPRSAPVAFQVMIPSPSASCWVLPRGHDRPNPYCDTPRDRRRRGMFGQEASGNAPQNSNERVARFRPY
ncbi:uncharacterized protein LOC113206343 isoform X1 [Frankliniella occidentalis]|uniref:Uncharacterized protein LOC113206343 isoform X1 n=1 Tax=Frankliniella occidentalis TaxID=133901 RepID=A0A6J1SFS4_FRAOC|nr:uncharacterized protein LOC113206343 isoform X1 [Frankliniella occidentalis]